MSFCGVCLNALGPHVLRTMVVFVACGVARGQHQSSAPIMIWTHFPFHACHDVVQTCSCVLHGGAYYWYHSVSLASPPLTVERFPWPSLRTCAHRQSSMQIRRTLRAQFVLSSAPWRLAVALALGYDPDLRSRKSLAHSPPSTLPSSSFVGGQPMAR